MRWCFRCSESGDWSVQPILRLARYLWTLTCHGGVHCPWPASSEICCHWMHGFSISYQVVLFYLVFPSTLTIHGAPSISLSPLISPLLLCPLSAFCAFPPARSLTIFVLYLVCSFPLGMNYIASQCCISHWNTLILF